MATDAAIVAGASILAYQARFDWLTPWFPVLETGVTYRTHAIPLTVATPIMVISMIACALYVPRRDQRFYREAMVIVRAVVLGLGLTIAVLSLFRNVLFDSRQFSAIQFGCFGILSMTMLIGWRAAFRGGLRWLRRQGWNLRHVAIIGCGRLGQVVVHTLMRNSWTGITPSFFLSHHPEARVKTLAGLPVRGGLNDLEKAIDADEISGVFIALPGRMSAELSQILLRLERYPLDVRVVPDMNPKFLPINMQVGELDGMPILSVRESPLRGWGRAAKRLLDVAGAFAALAVFGLPMVLIAILIRRSGPGPVIFRQERMSIYGKRFKIFKFRTMSHVEAEAQALRDAGKGTEAWTKADDPRITPLGRFLRSTSLDELPQLFNVLLGEMSLVGPRPERPELIERFKEDWRGYMLRQNVKAGMTGWAQVNGLRGDTSLKKRLQYDLFYIRNWSILFDLRILWLTIFKGFVHANAR